MSDPAGALECAKHGFGSMMAAKKMAGLDQEDQFDFTLAEEVDEDVVNYLNQL